MTTEEKLRVMMETADRAMRNLRADISTLESWVKDNKLTEDQKEELENLIIWMEKHAQWIENGITTAKTE